MIMSDGKSFGRLPVRTADDHAPIRSGRVACPRCGTVNCTRHSAGMLTSRVAMPLWRGL